MLNSSDRALHIAPNGKLKWVKKSRNQHGEAFIYNGKFYEHYGEVDGELRDEHGKIDLTTGAPRGSRMCTLCVGTSSTDRVTKYIIIKYYIDSDGNISRCVDHYERGKCHSILNKNGYVYLLMYDDPSSPAAYIDYSENDGIKCYRISWPGNRVPIWRGKPIDVYINNSIIIDIKGKYVLLHAYFRYSYAVYDINSNCIIWMAECVPPCTAWFATESVVIHIYMGGDSGYRAVNLIDGSEYHCADFCPGRLAKTKMKACTLYCQVCVTMSWVAISDDTSVRVFWYGYDGQPKSQLLRADTRVAVLCGIPFISFGELCLVTGYETGESATIVRLGNAEIAPVSYFLSCNVHVSKLPDGDEIVSCATYDDYCEITDVYRISANDRQYARILRLPPAYMGAYYCTPFVYSADMQKVIAAQSDQKYDIDLIAPIIPTNIAIGGDVFILRHICDTRDNRALLQAVMRSVSEDGNIGRHTYLLEYNLRTNDSIMITEIDDDVHKRNVVYVAQNIVVVTMVRRRNEIYRLQRLVINLADMTKYLVSDDIVRD